MPPMSKKLRAVISGVVALSLVGCLGTMIETPTPEGKPISSQHVHILAAPFRIDAHVCEKGVAKAFTFIPGWGVAVGILTIGIVVPKATIYHCVEGG